MTDCNNCWCVVMVSGATWFLLFLVIPLTSHSNLAFNLVKTIFSFKVNISKKIETLIKTIPMLLCAAEQPHPTFLALYFRTWCQNVFIFLPTVGLQFDNERSYSWCAASVFGVSLCLSYNTCAVINHLSLAQNKYYRSQVLSHSCENGWLT